MIIQYLCINELTFHYDWPNSALIHAAVIKAFILEIKTFAAHDQL